MKEALNIKKVIAMTLKNQEKVSLKRRKEMRKNV